MLISRYIFRQTATAVVMILFSLTFIVWLTSVLKEIKLLTSQGQTFFLFLKITSLALPSLIIIVAPIAFLIAALYSLNRLGADSELIVLSAAGASVWRLFTPYMALAALVSLSALATSLYVSPMAARLLGVYVSQVRADLISQVMQPGEFTDLEPGLTFHMRDKGENGLMLGVVVRDERDPKMATTVVAATGQVLAESGRSTMELYDGQILRQEEGKADAQIVAFKTYAFDVGKMSPRRGSSELSPRERDVSDLMFPDENSTFYHDNKGKIRSELHERLSSGNYAIVFAIIALVYLGRPRTTREGRMGSMVTAFTAGALVRVSGLAGINMVGKNSWALLLIYGVPLAVAILGLAMLRFNIAAPAISLPRLRLPSVLNALSRRAGASGRST